MQKRLVFDSLILGVAGALTGRLLLVALRAAEWLLLNQLAGFHPPGLPSEGGSQAVPVIDAAKAWRLPLVAALGGLLAGLLVYGLAVESQGHGLNTVVRFFHRQGGALRPRAAPVTLLAAAATLGSGGSAGREGPAALINAGIASLYATLGRRSESERRLLLLVGTAASLGAVFRAPISAAMFSAGIVYSSADWEAGAILYTMVGATSAYIANGLLAGWQSFFYVAPAPAPGIGLAGFGLCIALGILSGLAAVLLPVVFHGVRRAFDALAVWAPLKPALGGLGVGLLALALPQLLGGGYGWMQEMLDGRVGAGVLFALVLGKMLAFALTAGSGGSGGAFGPSLFAGASLGAGLAAVTGQSPAVFAVAGMVSVLGVAARVPVAGIIMATELTGSFALFVPAAVSVAFASFAHVLIAARFGDTPLYQAQMPGPPDPQLGA